MTPPKTPSEIYFKAVFIAIIIGVIFGVITGGIILYLKVDKLNGELDNCRESLDTLNRFQEILFPKDYLYNDGDGRNINEWAIWEENANNSWESEE